MTDIDWKSRAEAAEARVAELEWTLRAALRGLEDGCQQYAKRTIGDVELAPDEQYPWVASMMVSRDLVRAALTAALEARDDQTDR